MALAAAYLVDTNVLLRLSREDDPQHRVVQRAFKRLDAQGAVLHFSLQNIAEFWNVCTRPIEQNGYGLSSSEAADSVLEIEGAMTLLPDNEAVYRSWRGLVLAHDVRGVKVHDTKLAALMQVHKVPYILTFNQADFTRYREVKAVHPEEV